MAEKNKAKSASKKVATTKARSTVSSKPKTSKAKVTTAAKKAVAKKSPSVVTVSKKTKLPAVKKSPLPAVAKKTPTKKTAPNKTKLTAPTKKSKAKPTPEERYRMVETAAYFIAEQHGFQGRSDEHWTAAEHQIAAKLDM